MNVHPSQIRAEAESVLRRYELYWTVFLSSPLLYLLVCLGVERFWFEKKDIDGFWPLSQEGAQALWVFLGIAGGAAGGVVYFLNGKFGQWLAEAGSDPEEFSRLLGRRLFVLAMVCDTVALLGLVAFMIDGDLRPMAALGGYAYALYSYIYPRKGLLDLLKAPYSSGENGDHP